MAIKDLLKGLITESIEEMANSENETINNDNTTNEDTATEETNGNTESGEAGNGKSSTLNFDEAEFKNELKKMIKSEVRSVAGDILNRQPSAQNATKGVDVDAVFADLLGFPAEKKG